MSKQLSRPPRTMRRATSTIITAIVGITGMMGIALLVAGSSMGQMPPTKTPTQTPTLLTPAEGSTDSGSGDPSDAGELAEVDQRESSPGITDAMWDQSQEGDPNSDAVTVSAGEPVDLGFLNAGTLPQSVEQLKAMQTHVSQLAERVKAATVNINMGMGQGTGVIVSSDGIILTAAHVIGGPRRIALITFQDGSRARARTLGVEVGKDSGMLKIFDMIEAEPTEAAVEAAEETPVVGMKADDEEKPEATTPDESKGESEGQSKDQSEQSPELPLADPALKKKPAKANSDVIAEAFQDEDLPAFPWLDLGVSQTLNDGQWVMAIGHPGGLDEDRGMVVRVGRLINRRDDAMRSDCTLVGGDSGGPLVDMDGNVVGIHSRIGTRLQDNVHVPVDVFSETWDELIKGYRIGERGRLGVSVTSDSNVVSRVTKDGPAEIAGIETGDRIVSVDGNPVEDRKQLGRELTGRYPFERVKLGIRRGSRELTLEVVLSETRGRRR